MSEMYRRIEAQKKASKKAGTYRIYKPSLRKKLGRKARLALMSPKRRRSYKVSMKKMRKTLETQKKNKGYLRADQYKP